ncbi:MAG: hypothetical protein WC073_01535 [Sterolibacterium sp.]
MVYTGNRLRIAALILLCAYSALTLAGEDWLIARVNGLWTWERTGPEGLVQKTFPNQEVLRLREDGGVTAVSALPIRIGQTARCSESARRNLKQACSSTFLECTPDGSGAFFTFFGFLSNGGKGAADARNAYSCSLNQQAVLEAAHAVGLIESIAPKKPAK